MFKVTKAQQAQFAQDGFIMVRTLFDAEESNGAAKESTDAKPKSRTRKQPLNRK